MISARGLRQVATIRRGVAAVDGTSGRRTLDWSGDAIATDVPCSVQPAKRQSVMSTAGRLEPAPTHKMFANLPLDLRVGDRVEVEGSDTYEVRAVNDAAGRGHHLEADMDMDKGRGATPDPGGS